MRTIELTKWLREAGLIDLKQKPTLMVRTQPIDDFTKGAVTALLQSRSEQAQQVELPEEETRLWQELGDTDSANHIFSSPGFPVSWYPDGILRACAEVGPTPAHTKIKNPDYSQAEGRGEISNARSQSHSPNAKRREPHGPSPPLEPTTY